MSKRPKMLAAVIREVIAPVLTKCPPACGVVAISEVEVSGDFSCAKVYVSTLKEKDLALDFLKSQLPVLKRELGKISRSRVPELRFIYDERGERGARIDDLIGVSE